MFIKIQVYRSYNLGERGNLAAEHIGSTHFSICSSTFRMSQKLPDIGIMNTQLKKKESDQKSKKCENEK